MLHSRIAFESMLSVQRCSVARWPRAVWIFGWTDGIGRGKSVCRIHVIAHRVCELFQDPQMEGGTTTCSNLTTVTRSWLAPTA